MDLDVLDGDDWALRLRERFPILQREIAGKRLAYLDSGASAQKPERVLQAMDGFYRQGYANIHRGVHRLSVEATQLWDKARQRVAAYVNAPDVESCVFTRGATEAVNVFAHSVVAPRLERGDVLLVTEMEHHANLVPWHLLAQRTGAVVKGVKVNVETGCLDAQAWEQALREHKPKLVAVTHVSNVLGTVNPIAQMVEVVREHAPEALVLVDGAQAVPHGPVDVQALGADGYVFSGHKLFGPTGIGVLWARRELLADAPVYQGGGDMIVRVEMESSTYRGLPERFEAGTPHIVGAIGLAAAMDEVASWPLEKVASHERELITALRTGLEQREKLRVLPAGEPNYGAVSFVLEDLHPHDFGTFLDTRGVAIRVGHHCAQPLMKAYGVSATARASVAAYSSMEDVQQFFAATDEALAFFCE